VIEGSHCFASSGSDGSIHVVRVHVAQSGSLPKYSKLALIREHRVDSPEEYVSGMIHFNTDASSNLVYSTTHGNIVVLDLRTMRILQVMVNPRHHGPITALCVDRKHSWLVAATLTGVLSLWDLRFGLLLRTWRVGSAISSEVSVHQMVLHPTKGSGRWIIVALGVGSASTHSRSTPTSSLLEVWDVEKGVLVETFASREPSENTSDQAVPKPPADQSPETLPIDAAAAVAAYVQARSKSSATLSNGPSPSLFRYRQSSSSQSEIDSAVTANVQKDVVALAAGSDFGTVGPVRAEMAIPERSVLDVKPHSSRGFLITGSEDKRLRYWDLGRVERSIVLSGLGPEDDKPTYGTIKGTSETKAIHLETWTSNSSQGNGTNRAPRRTVLVNGHQQNLLKAHQDCITAVACVDSPFRGGIITGDRSGVIKVFRMDVD